MNAYPETLVARVVGVKKKRLAALRGEKLERGADWQFEDPRVGVVYTADGLKKLCALLGLDAAALAWPADAAAPAQPPEPAPAETDASAATERASADDCEPSGGVPEYGVAEYRAPASAEELHAAAAENVITPELIDRAIGALPPRTVVEAVAIAAEKIAEPPPFALPPGAPPSVNPPHESAPTVSAAVEARVEDLAQREQARPVLVLTVTKIARFNPHIVFARQEGATADVRIRVKTNVNFIPGMSIRARAPAAGSDVYSHEGHCPRRRGHY